MKLAASFAVLLLLPLLAFGDEDLCNFPECECPENIRQPGS